jgi:hypothetical protein
MRKELLFEVEQEADMLVAVCHQPEMATQGSAVDSTRAMNA